MIECKTICDECKKEEDLDYLACSDCVTLAAIEDIMSDDDMQRENKSYKRGYFDALSHIASYSGLDNQYETLIRKLNA